MLDCSRFTLCTRDRSFGPCMRYVQDVYGGYQWTKLRNIPSEETGDFKSCSVIIQLQKPFRTPAVSIRPGQLPTLKWNPVFKSGPKLSKNTCKLKNSKISTIIEKFPRTTLHTWNIEGGFDVSSNYLYSVKIIIWFPPHPHFIRLHHASHIHAINNSITYITTHSPWRIGHADREIRMKYF